MLSLLLVRWILLASVLLSALIWFVSLSNSFCAILMFGFVDEKNMFWLVFDLRFGCGINLRSMHSCDCVSYGMLVIWGKVFLKKWSRSLANCFLLVVARSVLHDAPGHSRLLSCWVQRISRQLRQSYCSRCGSGRGQLRVFFRVASTMESGNGYKC